MLTSAFIVGKAILEDGVARQVANFDAKLRLQAAQVKQDLDFKAGQIRYTSAAEFTRIAATFGISEGELKVRFKLGLLDAALKMATTKVDGRRIYAALATELTRIKAATTLDADKLEVEMAGKDALFDMETYKYGCAVMASISGGVPRTSESASLTSTAIGGALSGAAAGAMIGSAAPGIGTAAGAVGGAILGLAAAFV